MNDSRLISILKTFTDEDFKSFEKFLHSPFVTSSRALHSFLGHLKKFHPEYDSDNFTKEYIFRKQFPNERFNSKKFSNYIFDLTKAAEKFLIHLAVESDEIDSSIYLGKEFYNRKLFGFALKQAGNIEKKLHPEMSMQRELFLKIRTLEALKIDIHSETEKIPKAIESRHKFNESIIIQFMVDFIWMMGEQRHLQYNVFRSGPEDVFMKIEDCVDIDRLIENVKNFGIINTVIVSIYYYVYRITREPDNEENYYKLKELFLKNKDSLDHYEKFIIIFYLIKFSINIYNKGVPKFRDEMIDNHIMMLDMNAYSPNPDEYLQATDFRNLIHFTPSGNKVEFIESMIEKHLNKLNPDEREDIRLYSMAHLYFCKKDFSKSLEFLSKIKDIHKVFVMDAKLMKLKLFYELGYFDETLTSIDALKHYINKNKEIQETIKEQIIMFISVFSRIVYARSGTKRIDAGLFRKELEKSQLLYNRNWLQEKIEELDKID